MTNPNTYDFSRSWLEGVSGVQKAALGLGGFEVSRDDLSYLSYEVNVTLTNGGYMVSLSPQMSNGSGAAIQIIQFQVVGISECAVGKI